MSKFILLTALFGALTVQASTTDSKTLNLSNANRNGAVETSTQVTHTEYHTETYWDTCATETCSNEYSCWSEPEVCKDDRDCEIVDGVRHCSSFQTCTGGGQTCGYVDRCSTSYYSCEKTRSIPYEVFDYYLKTDAKVEIVEVHPSITDFSLDVIAVTDGSGTRLKIGEANKDILVAFEKTETDPLPKDSAERRREVKFKLTLIPVAKVNGPYQVAPELKVLEDGTVELASAATELPELVDMELRLDRMTLFGGVRVDRKTSNLSKWRPETREGRQLFISSLGELGLEIPNKHLKKKLRLGVQLQWNWLYTTTFLNVDIIKVPAGVELKDRVKFKLKSN